MHCLPYCQQGTLHCNCCIFSFYHCLSNCWSGKERLPKPDVFLFLSAHSDMVLSCLLLQWWEMLLSLFIHWMSFPAQIMVIPSRKPSLQLSIAVNERNLIKTYQSLFTQEIIRLQKVTYIRVRFSKSKRWYLKSKKCAMFSKTSSFKWVATGMDLQKKINNLFTEIYILVLVHKL